MGCAGLSPPPKIFCSKFFFLGALGSLASGGCGFAGGAGATPAAGVPFENMFCMTTCGVAPIWLQVVLGTVPSRNANE